MTKTVRCTREHTMKNYLILFVLGQDRPGIVDDLSTMLFERGANIEDSRMATLGGCFSVMILLSCPSEKMPGLEEGLEGLRELGFEASLHRAHDPTSLPHRTELPLRFNVIAMDHPGIVHKIVRLLRQYQVNIESLDTHVNNAPLSGTPLFDLELEAGVPAQQSIAEIKEQLGRLAAEMNLDLNFMK